MQPPHPSSRDSDADYSVLRARTFLLWLLAWLTIASLHWASQAASANALFTDRPFWFSLLYYWGSYAMWAPACWLLHGMAQWSLLHRNHSLHRALLTLTGPAVLWLVSYCVLDYAWYTLFSSDPWPGVLASLTAMNSFYYYFAFVLTCAALAVSLSLATLSARHREQLALAEQSMRAVALESQIKQARLNALTAQLEPHFIYNALNSITGLIRTEQKDQAIDYVSELSKIMRYALRASELPLVPLTDECNFTDAYIRMQLLRFGDKISLQWQRNLIAERGVFCPPFALQALVENAIKYCDRNRPGKARIAIEIYLTGDSLSLEVCNDAAPRSSEVGCGLGLSNLQERLQLLYSDSYALSLTEQNGQFVARLNMPLSIRGAQQWMSSSLTMSNSPATT